MLRYRSSSHEFSDWRLAFEVELKIGSHDELEGVSSEQYKKSTAWEKHGNRSDRELQHIYLDLLSRFRIRAGLAGD